MTEIVLAYACEPFLRCLVATPLSTRYGLVTTTAAWWPPFVPVGFCSPREVQLRSAEILAVMCPPPTPLMGEPGA